MKKVYEYSHLGGSEILEVRFPKIRREIDEIIQAVAVTEKTKISREKTMKGLELFSPVQINQKFKEEFRTREFREIRDKYDVRIPNWSHVVRGASKQVDFAKESVLVEVQFGKYAFMFYDMAKFQYFFNENKCDVGVEIVPCHALQAQMSSGVSYGEQLVYDIERLRRHFPAVPVKVIFVDVPLPPEQKTKRAEAIKKQPPEALKAE